MKARTKTLLLLLILALMPLVAKAQSPTHQPKFRAGILTVEKEFRLTSHSLTLTSPTVTFSAENKNLVILSSDASLTGIRPVNGTPGQVLTVVGAGNNSLRFDDSTTTTLGSNVTLTSASAALSLICISPDGKKWVKK